MTSLYDVLDVSNKATDVEIKKAYRKLAIKHHPDKGGDQELFQKISNAYTILSDKDQRESYDTYGDSGLDQGVSGSQQPNATDLFNQLFAHMSGTGSTFGDMFGNMSQQKQQRTPTKSKTIQVSLQDICTGKKKVFSINHKRYDQTKLVCCVQCRGTGTRITVQKMGFFTQQQRVSCVTCSGSGYESNSITSAMIDTTEQIELELPVGCPCGFHFLFKDKGVQDVGKKTSHLLLCVTYAKHKLFTTNPGTLDLHMTIDINLTDSLGGFTKTIEHPDGRIYQITTGNRVINPTKKYIIEGLGINLESENIVGCLIITFNIEYPESLNAINTDTTETNYIEQLTGQTHTSDTTDWSSMSSVSSIENITREMHIIDINKHTYPTDTSVFIKKHVHQIKHELMNMS